MKKNIRRVKGDRFCKLEVEISNRNGKGLELSICGTEGRLVADGPLHGLDVDGKADDGRPAVVESCGQIREELGRWFPEAVPFFRYHLNGMNAGCAHQRELGWGPGHHVTLKARELTQAQRTALYRRAREEARHEVLMSGRIAELIGSFYRDESEARVWLACRYDRVPDVSAVRRLVALGQAVTELEVRNLLRSRPEAVVSAAVKIYAAETGAEVTPEDLTAMRDAFEAVVAEVVRVRMANWNPAETKTYEDSLGAPCPECGYRYGSAWLFEELPAEVVAWVHSL